jgi:hypothetical protein
VGHRFLAAVVIGALAVGSVACGSKSGAVSSQWDSAARGRATSVATQLRAKFDGQCTDYALFPRVRYVGNAKKIGSKVPLAVGACTVLSENVEISVFTDAKHRDDFVARRGSTLCERAKTSRVDLPGLHWVVGGNWSAQPDSEGVGRRIASALGAHYRLTACKTGLVDWDSRDVARVDALAAALVKANVGCSDFQLHDRELDSHNPHYIDAGLPGAYGKCTVGTDANVLIGSFENGTVELSRFLPAEQAFLCAQAKTARVVTGTGFAVFVPTGGNVAPIARAVHGKLFGGPCP